MFEKMYTLSDLEIKGTHRDLQGPTGTRRDPQGPTGTNRDPGTRRELRDPH